MDPVEPLEAERDPAAARDRAAGEPGQAADGHDRDAEPMGDAEHAPDGIRVRRPHDDVRRRRLRPALVRRERLELSRLGRDGRRPSGLLELAHEVRRYLPRPHQPTSLVFGG